MPMKAICSRSLPLLARYIQLQKAPTMLSPTANVEPGTPFMPRLFSGGHLNQTCQTAARVGRELHVDPLGGLRRWRSELRRPDGAAGRDPLVVGCPAVRNEPLVKERQPLCRIA